MQVSEQIIQAINELCKKFGIAMDWTNKNIIPYMQQLGHKIVIYDLCRSIMWLVVGGLIPILVVMFLTKLLIKKKNEAIDNKKSNFFYYHDGSLDGFTGAWCVVIIIALSIASIVSIVLNTQNIIQDLVLPEKTILEFIQLYLA